MLNQLISPQVPYNKGEDDVSARGFLRGLLLWSGCGNIQGNKPVGSLFSAVYSRTNKPALCCFLFLMPSSWSLLPSFTFLWPCLCDTRLLYSSDQTGTRRLLALATVFYFINLFGKVNCARFPHTLADAASTYMRLLVFALAKVSGPQPATQ